MLDEKIPKEKTTNENVRLQNLRDFTVQIRDTKTDAIVGTGIILNSDGLIVTCAHVVDAAGVDYRFPNGKDIGIYFPQARGGEEKKYRALIEKYFSDNDDDIVILKLKDGRLPLAPEQMPVLGTAELSEGNDFSSYGYRSLGSYTAGRADGIILGLVERPDDLNLLTEPVQLKSQHIAEGMSGSGVLDRKRNLLIGIISETYFPRDKSPKDRDTAWAVDADAVGKLLTFEKISNVLFQEQPYPLRAAPQSKADEQTKSNVMKVARTTVEQQTPKDKFSWNNAPAILPEWTGRDDLLAQITADWNNPQKHVTGLIGFGGEGKSSLARKWVDTLTSSKVEKLEGSNVQTFQPDNLPTGIFWWGFYENRSIDEFLEAALNFLSGGRIDPRQVPSSSLRAQIIGAMLGAGRYLFVLDGLEVLQHQEGDQYGLLQSNDLRDLLTYFARPDNQSFCLITSRAPVLDLMEYTTYTHRDVDRLSEADGILLLEKLGVKGSKEQMGKVVSDWDGHALTISLLGSYLAEKYDGDIAHLADIPIPTADEPRYERVHRVLRRYDEHLTAAEREFLKLFSAFRTPVHESAFEKVFVPLMGDVGATRPAQTETKSGKTSKRKKTPDGIDGSPLRDIVSRLVTYRILHRDVTSQTYTAHPLVRNHYLAILTHGDSKEQQDVHDKIKDYYLSIAGDTPQFPTLDDLKPLIEVVHHACQAGAYDEAWKIYLRIQQRPNKFVLNHELGSYDTDLNLLTNFFPNSEITVEPLLSKSSTKQWVLNQIGWCLTSLGRLREAISFYERCTKIAFDMQDWENASITYQNLADLHAQLGALGESAEAARQALDLARKAEGKNNQTKSIYYQAWANYLLGNMELAGQLFLEAEKTNKEVYSWIQYLHSLMGIGHAIYLRRRGDLDYAHRVNKANLQGREREHKVNQLSDCYRVFGDLDFDSGNPESARAHYESALKIARSISVRQVLIEALLARGRFYAKVVAQQTSEVFETSEVSVAQAFTDLNEALNYAVEGGYRIYEADIRVALAWAYLADLTPSPSPARRGELLAKAKQSAERALQMSQEMGYHWGKVDAEEVLKTMSL
jgi:tetratricopeptide (TPR) repeat protein